MHIRKTKTAISPNAPTIIMLIIIFVFIVIVLIMLTKLLILLPSCFAENPELVVDPDVSFLSKKSSSDMRVYT